MGAALPLPLLLRAQVSAVVGLAPVGFQPGAVRQVGPQLVGGLQRDANVACQASAIAGGGQACAAAVGLNAKGQVAQAPLYTAIAAASPTARPGSPAKP